MDEKENLVIWLKELPFFKNWQNSHLFEALSCIKSKLLDANEEIKKSNGISIVCDGNVED